MSELTLGWQVIDWIEEYLVHGPGDVQGSRIFLTDEQARFIIGCYRLTPEGRRVVRRAVISRAKGWAKSELAGILCCVEGLGPVRFDGFDAKREPVGRPVTAPEVLCLATEENQAGNTYDNVVYMLNHLREHHEEYAQVDPGLTRTFVPGGGEIAPASASATSKDGGKSSFVVFDECHLYETPGLRNLHAMVRRNLGKRKDAEPWSLETTTMYRPGMNSVAEATHEYARAIADGRRSDEGLLFDHRGAPEDFDFDDDDELRAALEETYGDAAGWMDLDRIIAEIRDPQSDEAESRRYWLNQVVRSTEQAFDPIRWRSLAGAETVPDRTLITLGFDGARFHDSTALVGTTVATGHQFVLGVWEHPLDENDEWEVDETEVDAAVEHAFDTFDVWRLYADPPYWETTVAGWAGRYGERRIVRWYTNRVRPMAFSLRAYASAMRAGDLTHDGNDVMGRHIANARRRLTRMRDEDGKFLWLIQKEHPSSPNKIDLTMAGDLSWEARSDAIAAGVTTNYTTASF